MESCIFCKIIAGDIPSQKAHHEDDKVVSFLDVNQDIPGHTLVVPAKHYQWFWELPDAVANDLFKVARKLAGELKEKMGADYIHLSIVGVDVPHVHMHLLPRFLKDTPPEI